MATCAPTCCTSGARLVQVAARSSSTVVPGRRSTKQAVAHARDPPTAAPGHAGCVVRSRRNTAASCVGELPWRAISLTMREMRPLRDFDHEPADSTACLCGATCQATRAPPCELEREFASPG